MDNNEIGSWLTPPTKYVLLIRVGVFVWAIIHSVLTYWIFIQPSNVWEALFAVFPGLMISWYGAAFASRWYSLSYSMRKHSQLILAASLTDPLFAASYIGSIKRINPNYISKLSDEKFLKEELELGEFLAKETVLLLARKYNNESIDLQAESDRLTTSLHENFKGRYQ